MKKTTEEKNAEKLAKKQARKEKAAAKRAKLIELRKARAAAKKQRREAKRARLLAIREKKKARKLAIREKKRAIMLKKREQEKAKKLKLKEKAKAQKTMKQVDAKLAVKSDGVDVYAAAKTMKSALAQIASEIAKLDAAERDKKLALLSKLGYSISIIDGIVNVEFVVEKTKKLKAQKTIDEQPKEKTPRKQKTIVQTIAPTAIEPEVKAVSLIPDVEKPAVEMIPAGDLFGNDGQVSPEVANIEPDDDPSSEDGFDENDDGTIADSRDETDEDLVEARREFFGNAAEYGDDFEN